MRKISKSTGCYYIISITGNLWEPAIFIANATTVVTAKSTDTTVIKGRNTHWATDDAVDAIHLSVTGKHTHAHAHTAGEYVGTGASTHIHTHLLGISSQSWQPHPRKPLSEDCTCVLCPRWVSCWRKNWAEPPVFSPWCCLKEHHNKLFVSHCRNWLWCNSFCALVVANTRYIT